MFLAGGCFFVWVVALALVSKWQGVREVIKNEKGVSNVFQAFFYTYPRVEVKPFWTDSGLLLNVPVEGDQCVRMPFCTPYPAKGLKMRCYGNIRCGFSVATGS